MATTHVLTCPVCHSSLLVENSDSIGGTVVANLVLLDSAVETPEAAAARATYETALDTQNAAEAALVEATGETPIDDVKVAAANQTLADATKAAVDAQAAYDLARTAPPPPPAVEPEDAAVQKAEADVAAADQELADAKTADAAEDAADLGEPV